MALNSMTMAAPFLPTTTKLPTTTGHRSLVAAQAASTKKTNLEPNAKAEQEGRNTARRDLMFAAVAGAALSMARSAMADEEPKPGTAEARKKYAPVCVTNPTARVCRN